MGRYEPKTGFSLNKPTVLFRCYEMCSAIIRCLNSDPLAP